MSISQILDAPFPYPILPGLEFQRSEAYEILQHGDLLMRMCSLLGECLKQTAYLSLQHAATQVRVAFPKCFGSDNIENGTFSCMHVFSGSEFILGLGAR